MGFIIASINNTATWLSVMSFIAFLVFAVNGIVLYQHAFWVMVISLIICLVTPNDEEYKEFFKDKHTID